MRHLITPAFKTLIGAERLESLNNHPGSVYGLDSDLNIAYLNPAWFKFCEDNGNNIFDRDEWSLGRNIFDCIPGVLESYYRDLYETALNELKSPKRTRQSAYECSSPELYRRYSMHLYSMGKGGLVIVNSLVVEEPHESSPVEGLQLYDEANYIDKNGIVYQCANCRCIRRLNNPGQWDWIPRFIEKPHPLTSHGICKPCAQYYYLSR